MNIFPERLLDHRNKRGLTQAKLAELIGRKRGTIANYEAGESTPDFETIYKLCEALSVTPDDLMWPVYIDENIKIGDLDIDEIQKSPDEIKNLINLLSKENRRLNKALSRANDFIDDLEKRLTKRNR